MSDHDETPAFPEAFYRTSMSEVPTYRPGMSLRDWFAGQALVGISHDCGLEKPEAAETAYEFADAMLAQRTKPPVDREAQVDEYLRSRK